MYVCVCNAVTERQIQALAEQGVSSVDEMGFINGCSTTCGSCMEHAEQVLQSARKQQSQPLFQVPLAAACNA